ncbi:MAG TPA: hypothetical protein VFI56_24545 [Vicinamibacterales bacterium]|nr:hypothetical protein [Vicinamibacterales bacterium]
MAATADRPASILNGTTAIPSSGTTAAAIETDLAAVNGGKLIAPYITMKSSTAIAWSKVRDAAGGRAFPGVSWSGGDVWGIPVLVSDSVGDRIAIVYENEVVLDDNLIELINNARNTPI